MKKIVRLLLISLMLSTIDANEIILRDCTKFNTIAVGSITEWKSLGGFTDDGKPTEKKPRKLLIWARITIKKVLKSELKGSEPKIFDILFFEPVLRDGETTGYTITIKEFLNQQRIWSFNDYGNLILYPGFTFNTIDQENGYLEQIKTLKK